MGNFNQLFEAEEERLSLLVEECGEALQIVGKIVRHGYESYHPDDPTRRPNRSYLEKEVGDILIAVEFLVSNGDLDQENINSFMEEKRQKIWNFLHHQTKDNK